MSVTCLLMSVSCVRMSLRRDASWVCICVLPPVSSSSPQPTPPEAMITSRKSSGMREVLWGESNPTPSTPSTFLPLLLGGGEGKACVGGGGRGLAEEEVEEEE